MPNSISHLLSIWGAILMLLLAEIAFAAGVPGCRIRLQAIDTTQLMARGVNPTNFQQLIGDRWNRTGIRGEVDGQNLFGDISMRLEDEKEDASLGQSGVQPANPPFTDVEGEAIHLQAPAGAKLYVVFWCTWCPAVTTQTARIAGILREKIATGDAVIAICMDFDEETFTRGLEIHGPRLVDWRHAHAGNEAARTWVRKSGVEILPTVVVYDDSGSILSVHTSLSDFPDADD